MPPEKSAYALARYSRSPDSIADSLAWVKGHSAAKFLDSFYFQYGHASIADLGHCVLCFEGISELAAIEIEDEQLWDGQAKSSRYQDFSKGSAVVPDELRGSDLEGVYTAAAADQLRAYLELHAALIEPLRAANPKPRAMQPGAYRRTIEARAFDVARYLLFAGISTNVGQVTSIRTLERQMRKLGVSEYGEVRSLAEE
ncbi:MAG: FAD-dependent thymidylate synthase, partial [Bryobacterales bacterium]|nr:FAD-dependent thymidylate synthase [Bryobacterales bacterium]